MSLLDAIKKAKGTGTSTKKPSTSSSSLLDSIKKSRGDTSSTPRSTFTPYQFTEKKEVGGKVGKFLARTSINFADLVTESLDFGVKFIIDNPIFNAGDRVSRKVLEIIAPKKAEKREEVLNKWKDIYKTKAEKPKLAVDKIQQIEYLQPSKEYQKASLKDKLIKHPGETLAILGPSIIPSFLLYATNPLLGQTTTVGSTANDIKVSAIESGVPEKKAEALGLVGGILVGALDRLVPDELFTKSQKKAFIGSLTKRVIKMGLKEAGTEIAQEDIQIAIEATFREDLGWDEILTRNVMSALGGLLGGAGMTTVMGTINQTVKQEIMEEVKPEEAKKEVVEKPTVVKEKVVEGKKVAQAGLYDTSLDPLLKEHENILTQKHLSRKWINCPQ